MARKRFTTERIISKLREDEILLAKGELTPRIPDPNIWIGPRSIGPEK